MATAAAGFVVVVDADDAPTAAFGAEAAGVALEEIGAVCESYETRSLPCLRWRRCGVIRGGIMDALTAGLKKAAIASAQRHLFLCMGPDCCVPADAEILWEYVKQRVRETGAQAMRTKAQCFRICTGGPWVVVYPEGVWYGEMTKARFDRILAEHVIAGQPVTEWAVATNGLCGQKQA